jgi:phage baseplate assembly protein W
MPEVMTGYQGVSFPMRVGPTGKVETSSTNDSEITHIIESVKQIIGTRCGSRDFPGERYSIRDFGSNASSVLFSPINSANLQVIKSIIAIALAKWEKRVILKRVEITGVDEDMGKVVVEMEIFIIKTQSIVTVEAAMG